MIEKIRNLDARGKNIFECILIVLAVIVFLGILLVENIMDAKREQEESMKTILVTDASRYFTVLSCVRSFVNTVSTGSRSDLVLLLDSDYKERNRIDEVNVKTFLPELDASSSYDYTGDEMYEKRLSKNVTTYFVKGRIKKVLFDENPVYMNYDMTITLHESDFIFTVEPGIGGLDYEE